jgi:hypothetical protein
MDQKYKINERIALYLKLWQFIGKENKEGEKMNELNFRYKSMKN